MPIFWHKCAREIPYSATPFTTATNPHKQISMRTTNIICSNLLPFYTACIITRNIPINSSPVIQARFEHWNLSDKATLTLRFELVLGLLLRPVSMSS